MHAFIKLRGMKWNIRGQCTEYQKCLMFFCYVTRVYRFFPVTVDSLSRLAVNARRLFG